MPIFFVSLIKLYELGFEELQNIPEDQLSNLYDQRDEEIRRIMELQFMLACECNVSKADSDNMTPFELNNWFNLWKKKLSLENEKNSE